MFLEEPCLAGVACCTYLYFGVPSDITWQSFLFGPRWIQGCVGLSMGINIHIFIPGEVLCYGYNAIVSYVLFVKILIIRNMMHRH